MEVGLPTLVPIVPIRPVEPKYKEAIRVASTIHAGSYEGLGDSWGELYAWIGGQELKSAVDHWEVYLVGPLTEPDSSKRITQLLWRVT